jgi:hypothetical protein
VLGQVHAVCVPTGCMVYAEFEAVELYSLRPVKSVRLVLKFVQKIVYFYFSNPF